MNMPWMYAAEHQKREHDAEYGLFLAQDKTHTSVSTFDYHPFEPRKAESEGRTECSCVDRTLG